MHQIIKSQSCFLKHLSPLSRPIRYTFKVSHSGAANATPEQEEGLGCFEQVIDSIASKCLKLSVELVFYGP